MKLIKPERGAGVLVEQNLVPIKIIEHVTLPTTKSKVTLRESFFYFIITNNSEVTILIRLSIIFKEKNTDSSFSQGEETVIKRESVKRQRGKNFEMESDGDSSETSIVVKNKAYNVSFCLLPKRILIKRTLH